MTNHRRSGQEGAAFEVVQTILHEQLKNPIRPAGARCIYFRKEDPAAPADGDRGLYQFILSSQGCMEDAAKYGANGHQADGTWKAVEDSIVTDAVTVLKPCTAEGYPSVPELHSGHRKHDSRQVALSFSDKENQHAIQRIHESIKRCMPCRDPNCIHGWKTIDFPDGSGFQAMRTCLPSVQINWNSPAMIDHHEVGNSM
jgi:hypothetical protein